MPGNKLVRGMEEAVAYAKGDTKGSRTRHCQVSRPTPYGPPQTLQFYFVDDSHPRPNQRVMVWGNGGTRFGYRDERGNWRRLHHRPMNGTPKCYAEIPKPNEGND